MRRRINLHIHKWEELGMYLHKCTKCNECQMKSPLGRWRKIPLKNFEIKLKEFRNDLEIGDIVECDAFSSHFAGTITQIDMIGQVMVLDKTNNSVHFAHCKLLKKIVDKLHNPSRRDCMEVLE